MKTVDEIMAAVRQLSQADRVRLKKLLEAATAPEENITPPPLPEGPGKPPVGP